MGNSLENKISGKYWIKNIINKEDGKVLNEKILERDTRIEYIKWLSPLEEENYREYMLSSPRMLEKLNLNNFPLKKEDLDFWPSRQPLWNGIGLGKMKDSEEKILILLENKSDIKELKSKLASKNEENRNLILDTMKETYDELGIKGDFDKWFNNYYQFSNRITFMHQLMKRGYKVKLIFFNVVEDHIYKNISKSQWVEEYCKVLNEIIGERFVPRDVIIIDFNVHEE